MVLKKFCPINEMDQIQTKLWNHKVVGTNLKEYNTKFLEYCRIVPHLVTPEVNKVTRYIYGLPIEIHDLVRSHMPSSMESAMELAGYLMDGVIRNRDERKKDDGKTPVGGKVRKTKKKREEAFRPGHVEADCTRKTVECFVCGEKGHYINECSKKKKPTTVMVGASGSGAKTDAKKGNARVFMLDTQKEADIPDVITDKHYEVETADGGVSRITEALDNATISLANHVIHARILCNDKATDIRTPNNKSIRITGDKEGGKVRVISKIKASHCIGKGCLAFMAYITKEPEPKKMEEVPIVSEFQDVFPNKLPGAPPDREVEFKIDLMPGTSPIAKSPYHLAPT
ncbi:uncharacterized protein LOC143545772 [Bidens hawaiensis]|uniref:uncharacterized protein LOC143545772 n=1 Tax=Bidens hawaiensis TaxID=980011 RepID=UPI00404A4442